MSSSDSRDRMLRSAAELFGRHGYHATSWRQVVDHGKAPWGSINFLFPKGKNQLGTEAIGLSGREFDGRIRQLFFDPTDVSRALVAVVDAAAEQLKSSDFEIGCAVATVALELAHSSAEVQAACNDAFEMWLATLTELLTPQLGAESASELSGLFLSAYEGAVLRARTKQSVDPLTELAELIPGLIKALS